MRDPYECLAVSRTATAEEISRSFRQLAKQLHPDINKDPKAAALFVELSVAHDILSDEDKRRAFDRHEIDAQGNPALLLGRSRSRLWRAAALAMAVLMIAASSVLIIQRLRPQSEVNAGGARDLALSGPADNEERPGPAQVEKPNGARSEPHLILQQNESYAADNSIPLGLQVSGEADGLTLDISGLPSGTSLTSGRPIGGGKWRILAVDVGNAMIRPPQGFRGALDFVVELRLADDTIVDSGSFRVEWTTAASTAPVQTASDGIVTDGPVDQAKAGSPPTEQNLPALTTELDREQIELLIGRSQEMMRQGDVGAARTLLQRAAEKHDARAALALGATFDPIMLAFVQARGVAGDISSAQDWYKKASDLGSLEAQQRLRLLASAGVNIGPIAVSRVTVSRKVAPGAAAKDTTSGQAKRTGYAAPQSSHEAAAPAPHNDASGVYVAGERVGADPDPNIRSQLLRDDASRQLKSDTAGRQLPADPVRPKANAP